jgi:flagellar hook assembly protein FlgD
VDSLMANILEFFDIRHGVIGIKEIPDGDIHAGQQNYPNPFRDETFIPLRLEKKSNVDVAVYDLQGRNISTLVTSRMMDKGSYQLSWDARDDGGNPVPDGVYFYRILIDEKQYTGKMVLIR